MKYDYLFEIILLSGAISASAQCVQFTKEHVDLLSFIWDGTNLNLMASDDTHGINYASNQCAVVCPESMKFSLPNGTPLGNGGDPLWILPQSSYAGVPYVGISAQQLPSGIFEDSLLIELKEIDGPGQFMVWQSTSFGDYNVRMSSSDGIDTNDVLTPYVGGHEHYNWGFTTNGIYHVYFQASGILISDSQRHYSPITPFTFFILPLSPYEQWVTNQWGGESDTNIIAIAANPDHDRLPNLLEYAQGTSPKAFDGESFFTQSFIITNGLSFGAVSYQQSDNASDAICEVLASNNLNTTNWQVLTNVVGSMDDGTNTQIKVLDSVSRNEASQRFYKIRVRLK